MHPILFQLGPLTVMTHDAFTVLALAVGLAIYYRELRRRGWLGGPIVWISLAAVLGGAIGARVITSWEHLEVYGALADRPFSEVIEHSGKSILGRDRRRLHRDRARRSGRSATRARPATAICWRSRSRRSIGRVGCFLSELPLGTPTDLPWGISVSPAAAAAFARCPGCDVPMHPSMLYEIALQPRRHRRDPALPRPGRGPGRRGQALPAGGRDLPVPRRVRPRQRAAGAGPDRAPVGPDPDGRRCSCCISPGRSAATPTASPRRRRRSPYGWRDSHDRRRHADGAQSQPDQPASKSRPAADLARRAVADRDRASSSWPTGCRRSARRSRTPRSSGRRSPAGSRPRSSPQALDARRHRGSTEHEAIGPVRSRAKPDRPRGLRPRLAPLRDPVPRCARPRTASGRSCRAS